MIVLFMDGFLLAERARLGTAQPFAKDNTEFIKQLLYPLASATPHLMKELYLPRISN